jgi:hypothetical protein
MRDTKHGNGPRSDAGIVRCSRLIDAIAIWLGSSDPWSLRWRSWGCPVSSARVVSDLVTLGSSLDEDFRLEVLCFGSWNVGTMLDDASLVIVIVEYYRSSNKTDSNIILAKMPRSTDKVAPGTRWDLLQALEDKLQRATANANHGEGR